MPWNKSLDAVKDEIRNRQEGQRRRRNTEKAKKKTAVEELMAETINYGGMAATREQAYSHALDACSRPGVSKDRTRRAAEMFAFGPKAKAIDPEAAKKLISFNPNL